jgi:hypothetical protein
MLPNQRAKQVPERARESLPKPDEKPEISEETNGQPSSCPNESKEPGQDEEKRWTDEKLRELG